MHTWAAPLIPHLTLKDQHQLPSEHLMIQICSAHVGLEKVDLQNSTQNIKK